MNIDNIKSKLKICGAKEFWIDNNNRALIAKYNSESYSLYDINKAKLSNITFKSLELKQECLEGYYVSDISGLVLYYFATLDNPLVNVIYTFTDESNIIEINTNTFIYRSGNLYLFNITDKWYNKIGSVIYNKDTGKHIKVRVRDKDDGYIIRPTLNNLINEYTLFDTYGLDIGMLNEDLEVTLYSNLYELEIIE